MANTRTIIEKVKKKKNAGGWGVEPPADGALRERQQNDKVGINDTSPTVWCEIHDSRAHPCSIDNTDPCRSVNCYHPRGNSH